LQATFGEINKTFSLQITDIDNKAKQEKCSLQEEIRRLKEQEEFYLSERNLASQNTSTTKGQKDERCLSNELSELEFDSAQSDYKSLEAKYIENQLETDRLRQEIKVLVAQHKEDIVKIEESRRNSMVVRQSESKNLLADVEMYKGEICLLRAAVEETKRQWENETKFLKDELSMTYMQTAEVKVKYATVATEKDYFRLKLKQAVEEVKKMQGEVNRLLEEAKKKKKHFWEK